MQQLLQISHSTVVRFLDMKEFIVVCADTCLPSSDNYSTDIGCMHVKLLYACSTRTQRTIWAD